LKDMPVEQAQARDADAAPREERRGVKSKPEAAIASRNSGLRKKLRERRRSDRGASLGISTSHAKIKEENLERWPGRSLPKGVHERIGVSEGEEEEPHAILSQPCGFGGGGKRPEMGA